jgi:hypothetical protein
MCPLVRRVRWLERSRAISPRLAIGRQSDRHRWCCGGPACDACADQWKRRGSATSMQVRLSLVRLSALWSAANAPRQSAGLHLRSVRRLPPRD